MKKLWRAADSSVLVTRTTSAGNGWGLLWAVTKRAGNVPALREDSLTTTQSVARVTR